MRNTLQPYRAKYDGWTLSGPWHWYCWRQTDRQTDRAICRQIVSHVYAICLLRVSFGTSFLQSVLLGGSLSSRPGTDALVFWWSDLRVTFSLIRALHAITLRQRGISTRAEGEDVEISAGLMISRPSWVTLRANEGGGNVFTHMNLRHSLLKQTRNQTNQTNLTSTWRWCCDVCWCSCIAFQTKIWTWTRVIIGN